jgi:hypothetical protein
MPCRPHGMTPNAPHPHDDVGCLKCRPERGASLLLGHHDRRARQQPKVNRPSLEFEQPLSETVLVVLLASFVLPVHFGIGECVIWVDLGRLRVGASTDRRSDQAKRDDDCDGSCRQPPADLHDGRPPHGGGQRYMPRMHSNCLTAQGGVGLSSHSVGPAMRDCRRCIRAVRRRIGR